MPLRRSAGDYNAYLELTLYCNRIQLATHDALYSDGNRYTPARAASKALKAYLPSIHNVLVLGAGLGSMVHVLRRGGYTPGFTLVERDKVVLQWAMEFFTADQAACIEPVCGDAALFMAKNTRLYDLIFLDVFNGRVVPAFVCSIEFLTQCRNSLKAGGYIAFNYIVNDNSEWENVRHIFTTVFPHHNIVQSGINRIMTGKCR